ncbi:MAG TPA: hypothetical protein VHW03_00640, partial [Chthoniobacterales bacterium]|nr:hypothetical protein [Chthoniobacterales bacterium]
VDTGRAAGDRFKMIAGDRALFDTRLAALSHADNDVALTESNRAGGSGKARDALDKLKGLLHDGYNGITAIRSSTISEAQRLEVYTAYGWASGNIGTFDDARILGLSRLGISDDIDLENPAWEYAADLKADISAQLEIFNNNADDRTAGNRAEATKTRDAALVLFQKSLSRYRHYLASGSDDLDQSPELRRGGFKVRKDRTKAPKNPAGGAGGGTSAPTKP